MSLRAAALWVVAYDITDDRRRLAVHRYLRSVGVPVQYSVFVLRASALEMRALLADLRLCIRVHLDDVRAYRWPAQPELHELGRSMLPPDILVGDDSHPLACLID